MPALHGGSGTPRPTFPALSVSICSGLKSSFFPRDKTANGGGASAFDAVKYIQVRLSPCLHLRAAAIWRRMLTAPATHSL